VFPTTDDAACHRQEVYRRVRTVPTRVPHLREERILYLIESLTEEVDAPLKEIGEAAYHSILGLTHAAKAGPEPNNT
jgi:hypothetical protein